MYIYFIFYMLCGVVLNEIINILMFKMEYVVYMNLKVIIIKKVLIIFLNVCVGVGGGGFIFNYLWGLLVFLKIMFMIGSVLIILYIDIVLMLKWMIIV